MSGALLHLLRHGTPDPAGRMLGHSDRPVTADGIAQCMARCAGLAVDSILSSDLSRARDCAEALAAARGGLAVDVDPRWRELHFGAWEELTAGEIDPDALGRFWRDPDAAPPPGGERWSDLLRRVDAALSALPPRPALVVTHAGAMRAALQLLCGFEQKRLWAFDLPYAALLTLRIWPGEEPAAQIVGLAG